MADQDFAVYLNIDKWLKATAGMDEDTRAWYLDLLLQQYDKNGLENDIETLAGYARVRMTKYEKFKQVFEQVFKHKFELCSDGKLRNPYMNQIFIERKTFKENRAKAGQLSYLLKIFRSKHRTSKQAEEILKEIFTPEIDIKDQTQTEHLFKQVFERLRDRDRISISNNNGSKKDGGAGGRFEPPEKNDVAAYMAEVNFPGIVQDEAEGFIDFYESKGWMVGKNKMKDWKASVRTWKKTRNAESGQQTSNGRKAGVNATGSAPARDASTSDILTEVARQNGIAPNG